MCGIGGIIDLNQRQPDLIRKMAKALAHRGPDAEGLHEEGRVHLAHLRLSIIDTSDRANQPMQSPDGRYTMVFNGEVYNFRELKRELPGREWQSESDTEVVLAAYDHWGKDCVKHFNGMFAMAIWDRVKEELFLARDRMGIKPLYYHFDGEHFAFASEVRALLVLPWVTKEVDRGALANYLTYQTVYGTDTLVKGVRLMGAGKRAVLQMGDRARATFAKKQPFEEEEYWAPGRQGKVWDGGPGEVKNVIRSLLRDAVERRMISDVPLGAFLSGGIDSSAIVALMSEVSDQPVDTFSVVFEEKEFDESTYSEMIARKYNTRHHPIMLRPQDFLDSLMDGLRAMDHPSGDGINSYVVSQVTRREGIKVALSGLGGDELFAGYPIFNQIGNIQRSGVWKIPSFARRILAGGYLKMRSGRQAEKKAALLRLKGNQFSNIYPVYRTVFSPEEAADIVLKRTLQKGKQKSRGKQRGKNHTSGYLQSVVEEAETYYRGLISQTSFAEIKTYTHSVLLRDMDQMSMAHALETRVPFFDHELVDMVFQLSDEIKKPHYPKSLLVESMGDLLPHELVHRKKMGFVFPWKEWLRNDLRSFSEARINSLTERGLLDRIQVQRVWREFLKEEGPWIWPHVWLLVVLEEWLQNNGF